MITAIFGFLSGVLAFISKIWIKREADAANPVLQDAKRDTIAGAQIASDQSRTGPALATSAGGIADLDELDRLKRMRRQD